ncbi:MAG: alanine/glycine:cation symporter family protein [Rhodothermales bacterium]
MEFLEQFISFMNNLLAYPLIFFLLGTGVWLTLRLGFVQFRRLGHGLRVTMGKYDNDDSKPGDVSHFQALTTALSATVGIGNIAGVAIAIHWGGPGALFWMWMTALLGMATKYSEVTLAQHFRQELGTDDRAGSVAGGPMYYIEHGLGKNWKPVAMFFAFMLMITSFMTGNAIQANTVATQMYANFGIATWITGLITAGLVGIVIIGGIKRIGKVTSILAPTMAAIYVLGALIIIGSDIGGAFSAFGTIFSEAFNPTSGVAGTGIGVFLMTMQRGVQRGLFSNEAGQGSAPIAHSAAKTDEPVSEGVVALLEPFIDTLIICTLTGIVVVSTGVWNDKFETTLELSDGNISYVVGDTDAGFSSTDTPESLQFVDGHEVNAGSDTPQMAYFDIPVDQLFTDAEQTQPFEGTLYPEDRRADNAAGGSVEVLYGQAARSSSPLTSLGFERGLEPLGLGWLGRYIVLICVLMFALSTAISWSYYGDRCANYLWGKKAILPYKFVFVLMHFLGAIVAVTTIWDLGDVALSLVTIPNVIALFMLSGLVKTLTDKYFDEKPWEKKS